jgi:RNA recognition motif-containing protein
MKLFVGNLSFQSTDDSIRSVFAEHGQVDEVALITDRDTGRPRGFGFVQMPNDDEARAAIEAINGRDVDGRTLNVNEARAREGGGGGRSNRW